MTPPDLLEAGRRYRDAGLSVVPNRIETKYPPIPKEKGGWAPYQQRRATDEEMASWRPRWNAIGLVCGKVSGNLELLDFDSKGGRDATLVLQQWRGMIEEEAPALFDRLVVERTQNGGFHVIYRCPDAAIPGNHPVARFRDGAEGVLTLIETRGEGGQFLCSPSPGYRLMAGDLCDIPVVTAREREIMLEAARSFNEYVEPSGVVGGDRRGHRGKSPGDDFNERCDLTALLTKHRWVFVKGNEERTHWRRPGKDRGQSASILGGKTFYVFSSNAQPFQVERGYDAFGVYALLEHGGDFSKAAKDLARQGYGEKPRPTERLDGEKHVVPTKTSLEFPDIMSGVAGDFARLYSSYLEAPGHFFYMAFLTCLGITVADRLTLASMISPQPRLYVILLGESADDRKSTAITMTVDFFRWCLEKFPVCFGVGSAEGLQKRLEGSNRLLLCFDEFKQFISKCKIESSVLLPCVNTLFESNRYESRTQKSDIYLENAHLSFLAASTIPTYENTWSSAFTDIGFNNRLFLVPGSGDRRFSLPAKMPDNDRYLLRQRVVEILRHVGERRELDLTPEARELYHQWYMGMEKSVHTRRLDTYATRFMSLLTTNELKDTVDADAVQKVTALCDWQFLVRQLHDPIDADNEVACMEEKIRRVLAAKGDLTDRDLKKAVHTERKGLWCYDAAKRNLERAREVAFNRTRKRYFLRRDR